MIELLNWQVSETLEFVSFGVYLVLYLFTFLIFFILYQAKQREFFKVDGKFTPKEKEMLVSIFARYFAWGGVQQFIILLIVSQIPNPALSVSTGVLIFSVAYHWGNIPLMIVTAFMGSVIYSLWFFAGMQGFVYLVFLHSLGGTLLKFYGFDLRVWSNLPSEKRWKI